MFTNGNPNPGAQFSLDFEDDTLLTMASLHVEGDNWTLRTEGGDHWHRITIEGVGESWRDLDWVTVGDELDAADGPIELGDHLKAGSGKVVWRVVGVSRGFAGGHSVTCRSVGQKSEQGLTFSDDRVATLRHVEVES